MKPLKLEKQKGQKIGIFGLGLTGRSAYSALENVADTILCYDDNAENLERFKQEFGSFEPLVGISDKKWQKLDKILISPGVPPSHGIFTLCKEYNIRITSDIELFIEENPDSEFVLISGSNGKSTTTALVGHILSKLGLDYHIGGNIGLPILSLPLGRKGYIIEISSFQIELLKDVKVKIAALLNITPNHLDRYNNYAEYAAVKKHLLDFAYDYKILGIDSSKTMSLYEQIKNDHNLIAFTSSIDKIQKNVIFCDDHKIEDYYFNKGAAPDLVNYKTESLKGAHNRQNIAASYAICRALGVVNNSDIASAISSFYGLPHRMQYLGTKGNLSFFNDSKATTLIAARAALTSVENIYWLAGGIFKENDFEVLTGGALSNVKKAYLFGDSKNLFARFLNSKVEYEVFGSMPEAFGKAILDAKKESIKANIILSPACSSYDQFKNFEERGNAFIKMVDEI